MADVDVANLRLRRNFVFLLLVIGGAVWGLLASQRAPRLIAMTDAVHELVPDDVACSSIVDRCAHAPPDKPTQILLEHEAAELHDEEMPCTAPMAGGDTQRVTTDKEGTLLLYSHVAVPEPVRRSRRGRSAQTAEPKMRRAPTKRRQEEKIRFELDASRLVHPLGVCATVLDHTTLRPLGMTVINSELEVPQSLRHHGWFIEVAIFATSGAILLVLLAVFLQLRKAVSKHRE